MLPPTSRRRFGVVTEYYWLLEHVESTWLNWSAQHNQEAEEPFSQTSCLRAPLINIIILINHNWIISSVCGLDKFLPANFIGSLIWQFYFIFYFFKYDNYLYLSFFKVNVALGLGVDDHWNLSSSPNKYDTKRALAHQNKIVN